MNSDTPNNTNTQTHNTHNPLTGGGVTNTHNPFTGDKTGPQPLHETNPITGHTRDDNLGRDERQHADAHHVGVTGTGAGVTAGTNTRNNDHHNPIANDRTGPNSLAPDTDDHWHGGNRDPNERRLGGHTGTTDAHTGTQTDTCVDPTSVTNTHNTHNPLIGAGDSNTHDPVAGRTASHCI
ncbi:unnamed protein product [Rhizoctonia solani]|uniref:Uncharacterized protein n=1 Tax=Rhizoctonia solani TaxID=456999 RepID=A0A8H3CUD0_9AGAM|nr:unnamed protein product [Rhizoctonia solani]